jgi:tRNA dimethylallyltransferase
VTSLHEPDAPVPVTLIAGPTASGKSALALVLARQTGAAIINADSMQVYDGLRILSARPTAQEEADIPHHMFGHVRAGTEYSTGAYLRDLSKVLAGLKVAQRSAIIVGGTGLYFKAMIEGLVETPEVPPEIMNHLNHLTDQGEPLHERLQRVDPVMAAKLDPSDTPRIQRALGIMEATGKSLSWWWQEGHSAPLLRPGSWRGIVLAPPREALVERIDRRFVAMMGQGALEEARAILSLGLPRNRGIMKAHGMPHLIDHLEGKIDLATAIERGQIDTRRYAKRQRTFFRHQLPGFMQETTFGELIGNFN